MGGVSLTCWCLCRRTHMLPRQVSPDWRTSGLLRTEDLVSEQRTHIRSHMFRIGLRIRFSSRSGSGSGSGLVLGLETNYKMIGLFLWPRWGGLGSGPGSCFLPAGRCCCVLAALESSGPAGCGTSEAGVRRGASRDTVKNYNHGYTVKSDDQRYTVKSDEQKITLDSL